MKGSNHKWPVLSLIILLSLLFSTLFQTDIIPVAAQEDRGSFLAGTFTSATGHQVDQLIFPQKPPDVDIISVDLPPVDPTLGINILQGVPAFDWSYGCSPTAAAMLFGWYDRNGYSNIYTGPAEGGLCPLISVWGETSYVDVTCSECPLSASHLGVDGRGVRGHVDDYWVDYSHSDDDPYLTGVWEQHEPDSLADFMGTSQWSFGNRDGTTAFLCNHNGDPIYDYFYIYPDGSEPYRYGCHGMRLFAESRGYEVVTNYSQYIQGQASDPEKGFTFEDFIAQIEAGRPVLVHTEGHTLLGFGYNRNTSEIYVHDTWDTSDHTMVWGGQYFNAQQKAVSVIELAPPPLPAVTTVEASDVTHFTVTLNGVLTCLDDYQPVDVYFEWGESHGALDQSTPPQITSATGPFQTQLEGLRPGTRYYFKAVAAGMHTSFGMELSFDTPHLLPEVMEVSPAAGETGVGVDTTVRAVFNKQMDASTIGFSLECCGNSENCTRDYVSGALSYENETYTVTFTPNRKLLYGREYTAVISGNTTDEDGFTLSDPVSWNFTTEKLVYDIRLDTGWNMISIPYYIEEKDREPATILKDIADNLSVVWSYEACNLHWKDYKVGLSGTLEEIRNGPGYWIVMNGPGIIHIESPGYSAETPPAHELCKGWNLIGYSSGESMPAGEYLDGIKFGVIYTYKDANYSLVRTTDNLSPGSGYWISVLVPGTIYPH